MVKPELNSHQAQNNCLNCCLGSVPFGRVTKAVTAATAVIQLHRSRRHRTIRCILLHHHPKVPLADFSILHWLPASAEVITVVTCTTLLCLDHSSLPGRELPRNFKHRLATQIVVHTHHLAHFLLQQQFVFIHIINLHSLFSSYLLLVRL